MRKPLLALSLAVSTSLGVIPAVSALAAAPASSQSASSPSAAATNSVSGAQIIATAMKYLGYPYTATGNSPSTGFSCIGFVSFVYRSNGIPLPGDLQDAYAYAPQVPFSQLEPGDILYFQNTVWPGISHAAIYLGGGRFIHAEWYNRGVTTSSFNNDPKDGNYWIGKYLGANRPWGGAAVGAVPGGTTSTATGPQVSSTSAPLASSGPTGYVNAASLNVRAAPGKSSARLTFIQQGTAVTILGRHGNWLQVRLADGTIGWVMAKYVSQSSATPTTTATTVNTTPTAPARTGVPSAAATRRVTVQVSSLRVHTSPSLAAPVTTSVSQGQKLVVVGRSGGWLKVQLPDGSIGWVKGSYVSRAGHGAGVASFRKVAPTAMTVRAGASSYAAVLTTLPAGGRFRIIGWAPGWAEIQTETGVTGWVTRSSLAGAPSYSTYTPKPSIAGTGNRLTASVRVHSGPGVNRPVIAGATAGTPVQVLGRSGNWVLVRLPNGVTGYVLGAFVR